MHTYYYEHYKPTLKSKFENMEAEFSTKGTKQKP